MFVIKANGARGGYSGLLNTGTKNFECCPWLSEPFVGLNLLQDFVYSSQNVENLTLTILASGLSKV
ncbi:Uncharacterized protein APZ42_023848 [Daphnia magna]|uniref:Uncharacterized protein n=1 Tax=Daphnia magna TaxID=35525 RepID=A0A164U7B9_9CRUS|nr:Uncharacterized protein APZ42_023848 [Daphnia magna]